MKMKYKNGKLLAIIVALLVSSCLDLDINDDPNNPVDPEFNFLITSAEVDIAGALGSSVGGLTGITSAYVHQMFSRGTTQGDYGINGQDFEISTPWNILYARAGMDLEQVINEGTEQQLWKHVGIAQLLKAYMFSILVDVYADVPYSQAFQGFDNVNPQYDQGETIYPLLFDLIDTGVENLGRESILVTGDQFYGGDVEQWTKFANSLKLKMLNQLRLVQDVSGEVQALLADAESPLFENAEDDFQFVYGTSDNPENRNLGYAQEYNPGGARYYINPFFYETLMAIDGTTVNGEVFTHRAYGANAVGIQDPRVPYYFYNQLEAGSGDGDAENPCAYCPSNSGTSFLSIFMFSFNIDPNEGFDQSSSQTIAGLYPLGGHFDPAGEGGVTSYSLGTPSVPQRLLTYYAQLYTLAELQLSGNATGDHRATFELAMQESFAKVNEIAGMASNGVDISDVDRDNYINAVLADYDAGDDTNRLEHIITQKWIASFGFAIDAYTDYRRTGFPVLPTGANDGLSVTVQTREYPFSMPWPTGNLDLNTSAPAQKQIATDGAKVFWDQ